MAMERSYGSPTEIPEVPDIIDVWLARAEVNNSLSGNHDTWPLECLIEREIRSKIWPKELSKPHFVNLLHYQDKTEFRIISNLNRWKWQDKLDEKYCCLYTAESRLHKWFYRWWEDRWDINDIRIQLNKQEQTAIITKQEDHPLARLNPHLPRYRNGGRV